jgi:hypothetical protein
MTLAFVFENVSLSHLVSNLAVLSCPNELLQQTRPRPDAPRPTGPTRRNRRTETRPGVRTATRLKCKAHTKVCHIAESPFPFIVSRPWVHESYRLIMG